MQSLWLKKIDYTESDRDRTILFGRVPRSIQTIGKKVMTKRTCSRCQLAKLINPYSPQRPMIVEGKFICAECAASLPSAVPSPVTTAQTVLNLFNRNSNQ